MNPITTTNQKPTIDTQKTEKKGTQNTTKLIKSQRNNQKRK